jgi:NDP-sugar pyrophosphorylase family protein
MTSDLFPIAILAGGLATRLRPLTEEVPKSMLELNGEPFVSHQLRLLSRSGIKRAVFCVGYHGKKIEDYVGNGDRFGVQVGYSYDGSALRGTGGAVRNALPKLGESFFVIYGDSYLECDFREIQSSFVKSGRNGLMTVYRNEDRLDKSNVVFADGEILAYDKVQRLDGMKHIDYGLGMFRRRAFEQFGAAEVFDLATVYQRLLAHRQLAACEVMKRFYEIGSLKGIEELADHLREQSEGRSHDV